MSPVRAVAVYLVVIFAGAAILAPWIYFAGQQLSALLPFLKPLADVPFHRYLNRCLLALALVGIYPFLRATGEDSLQTLGLQPSSQRWRSLWRGFLLGFCSLAMAAAVVVVCGIRAINMNLSLGQVVEKFHPVHASNVRSTKS